MHVIFKVEKSNECVYNKNAFPLCGVKRNCFAGVFPEGEACFERSIYNGENCKFPDGKKGRICTGA